MSWATRYAACTVAVGLKVKPTAREQAVNLWPQLEQLGPELHTAGSIWPKATREYLRDILPARYPDHPIYETNSCALAYVLGRAGVHGTTTCTETNRCPQGQRGRCHTTISLRPPVTGDRIRAELAKIERADLDHTWHPDTGTLEFHGEVEMRDRHYLTQSLGIQVRADRDPADRYWHGRLAGGEQVVIDTIPVRK